jgi:hypothetical protein
LAEDSGCIGADEDQCSPAINNPMTKPFDPKRTLRSLSPELRRRLLEHLRVSDVEWDKVSPRKLGPLIDRILALPRPDLLRLQSVLHGIHILDNEPGTQILITQCRRDRRDIAGEVAGTPGTTDRAALAYLLASDVFQLASRLARLQALASSQYWARRESLPKMVEPISDATRERLGEVLSLHFSNTEMRGLSKLVEAEPLPDGSTCITCYFSSYPDAEVVFDNGEPVRQVSLRAFEVLFVYDPTDGALEMHARGGRKVREPIARIFAKVVLDHDLEPEQSAKPTYKLDHLLDPTFDLIVDPSLPVCDPRIVKLRLEPIDAPGEYVEIRVADDAAPARIYGALAEYLNRVRLTRDSVQVRSVRFGMSVTLGGTEEEVFLDVTVPGTTNLRGIEELRDILRRCLADWKITVATAEPSVVAA